MKKALLFGANGQDGSYMTELLLERGYRVIAVIRRSSTNTTERLKNVKTNPNVEIIEGDITDPSSITGIISKYVPEYCINFAAQSHVHTSFEMPAFTFQVNTIGVLNILEAIRHYSKHTKFITMSTSEQFGSNYDVDEKGKYQDEKTRFSPNSPYAVSKLAAFELCKVYKKSYRVSSCLMLCHNHESPRRGENFVTKKITKYIGQLVNHIELEKERYNAGQYWEPADLLGKSFPRLRLGNIHTIRDWSHAKDICEAIYLVMQEEEDDYYVVSSGEGHTVEEFLSAAFGLAGLNWKDYVVIDPQFYRPCEVEYLQGRSDKIRKKLGWSPRYDFETLVKEMVEYDIKEASNGFAVSRLH